MDITIITIFIIHLSITIIYAILKPRSRSQFFKSRVLMSFIPKWNFFAPIPGMHDFYLLYREGYDLDQFSDWKESKFYNLDKNWFSFIWNPNKRGKKILFDLSSSLLLEKTDTPENLFKVKLSIPYLLILNYLSHNCSPFAKYLQFTIGRTQNDHTKTEIMFMSDIHSVN